MAHAHASTYAEQPRVIVTLRDEIHINCGPFSIRMEREEAAQLAADLLAASAAAEAARADDQELPI
jgi:hypothetical protein